MADNNQPATKQDLLDLEERLIEKMRDLQTDVLRAFHDSVRPVKLRPLPMIDERPGLLEERISRLEREHPHSQ